MRTALLLSLFLLSLQALLPVDAIAFCQDGYGTPSWTAVPDSTVADGKKYVAILLEEDVHAGFMAYQLVQSLPSEKAWDVHIYDSDLVFLYSLCGSFQERAVSKIIIATSISRKR